MSLLQLTAILLGAAGSALGHGYVTSIDVDGTTYGGYLIDTYYYESDPPELIAWSTTATDNGYVAPTAYDDSDIVCHRGAEPGALSAEVSAGGDVTMFWNTWPSDHHGPVITYLAQCDGDCASVDKTSLEFFKIDAGGLIDNSNVPGTWATDELIAANISRTITIPSDIQSGNYVLRHEIIALHSAEALDGAQNYPQCINLKVTGSGTATPSGILGTALYKDTDPGIYVDIWNSLSTYEIPGPTLYSAGSVATGTSTATATTTTSTESSLATTTTADTEPSTTTTALATLTASADSATGTQDTDPTGLPEQTSGSPSQVTPQPEAPTVVVAPSSSTQTVAATTSVPSGQVNPHGNGGKGHSQTCKASKKRSSGISNRRRHARDISI
ncbi:glycosyl hydrolase family 61-domain-containing protein [Aspergillus cavernicola]|uniref:Glycosyl hydrolase family 61-domain-containing protein n=1 Tax=Aspergillus cavernicola TaxID=176166 RepID=A0ABR4HR98_9EURO